MGRWVRNADKTWTKHWTMLDTMDTVTVMPGKQWGMQRAEWDSWDRFGYFPFSNVNATLATDPAWSLAGDCIARSAADRCLDRGQGTSSHVTQSNISAFHDQAHCLHTDIFIFWPSRKKSYILFYDFLKQIEDMLYFFGLKIKCPQGTLYCCPREKYIVTEHLLGENWEKRKLKYVWRVIKLL